jgi:hypothetical protein
LIAPSVKQRPRPIGSDYSCSADRARRWRAGRDFVVVRCIADAMSYPPRLPSLWTADWAPYEDVFSHHRWLTLRVGTSGQVARPFFAHGGGGNRLGMGQLEQAAAPQHGLGVLLFDQRDHST